MDGYSLMNEAENMDHMICLAWNPIIIHIVNLLNFANDVYMNYVFFRFKMEEDDIKQLRDEHTTTVWTFFEPLAFSKMCLRGHEGVSEEHCAIFHRLNNKFYGRLHC